MPAVSQAQRKWAFGVKGPAWAKAHHFANEGPLPDHIRTAIKSRHKKRKKHGHAPPVAAAQAPSSAPSQADLQTLKNMLLFRSAARTR